MKTLVQSAELHEFHCEYTLRNPIQVDRTLKALWIKNVSFEWII